MERVKERIEKLERDYRFSLRRYAFLDRLTTIPSIIITSLSSIFSFISTSSVVDNDRQDVYIVVVAILTAIASMFQAISSSSEFGIKSTKFLEASHQINHLSDRVFFELQHSNEKDFIDKVEKELEQIKNQCKYIPLEAKPKKHSEYIELN